MKNRKVKMEESGEKVERRADDFDIEDIGLLLDDFIVFIIISVCIINIMSLSIIYFLR